MDEGDGLRIGLVNVYLPEKDGQVIHIVHVLFIRNILGCLTVTTFQLASGILEKRAWIY